MEENRAYNLEDIVTETHQISQKYNYIVHRYGLDSEIQKIRVTNNELRDKSNRYSTFYLTATTGVHKEDECTHIIYRNAPFAVVLQQHDLGEEYQFTVKDKIYRHVNKGKIINEVDLLDKSVSILGQDKRTFTSLADFCKQLQKTSEERRKKLLEQTRLEEERKRAEEEKRTAQEKARITNAINKLRDETRFLEGQIQEQLSITRYIHKHSQLRFRPVVDKKQSQIKFNDLYNGVAVIISGGPGTGKTTTMIGRLKYLTDDHSIKEDGDENIGVYELNPSQREFLLESIREDKDWMFFSPSQLLKEYLAKAMEGEHLSLPNKKTWNWDDFRFKMMQEYGFFNIQGENSPFKRSREEKMLMTNGSKVIDKLNDFYLERFYDLASQLPNLDTHNYKWKIFAKRIKEKLESLKGCTLEQLIDEFNLLRVNYEEVTKDFEDELRKYLEKISEQVENIYGRITQNQDDFNKLLSFVKIEKEEPTEQEEDLSEEDAEEAEVNVDEISEELKVFRLIQNVIPYYAHTLVCKDKKLTERQQKILDVISKYFTELDNNLFLKEGELILLRRYTKYVKGPSRILFPNFPAIYKRFRQRMLKDADSNWNLKILEKLIKNENKELHIQEQALLLGFVNNVVQSVLKKSSVNDNLSGKYIDLYNLYARPIIGIDEATDFSEVEIYSMISFKHYKLSSITIAGDVMQRMTDRGLQAWEQLNAIVKSNKLTQLDKSYRQSRQMLDVALRLFEDTMGYNPGFKAHFTDSKVPDAIGLISEEEDEKISWIEKRIIEVHKAYGGYLPSIAIFLNNEDDIPRFSKKLNQRDFFYDNGIKVVDCSGGSTIGETSQVRVFPINMVKGMEFDVVFFHNIDNTDLSEDLVKRYLYVGVSRASFYLGATFNNDCPELTKYFKMGETWK